MDVRSLRRRLTYLQRRHRRTLAAVLAFAATLGVLAVVRPSPPASVSVLVASHDLPAGATLASDDVRIAEVPADALPPGAFTSAGDLSGRTLSAPMSAGEMVTSTRLTDAALSYEEGTYAVPLRLADAEVAGLLAPGVVIDIVRDARGRVEVVAQAVRVITVPRRGATNSMGSSPNSTPGSLILVAADRTTAIRLAAAGTTGDLAAIMR
ncbi:MAG: Flp pilus assembly protein CpaB [Actinomycetota bacterium]